MPEKKGYKVELTKKPKGATIIEGFPGFGLVATIATGFLIDHLKCEQIGKYWFEDVQPTLAIHDGKLVDPIGIYYNQKNNVVIIHSIVPPTGFEWEATQVVLDICKQINTKELITVEGVGTTTPADTQGFYFTENAEAEKRFKKLGIECLGEGIIVGVSSALLLKAPKAGIKTSCLFSEAKSKLPDSNAAAKIIELLDQYLRLGVDYEPLLRQAQEFEKRLKTVSEQAEKAKGQAERKQLSYVG